MITSSTLNFSVFAILLCAGAALFPELGLAGTGGEDLQEVVTKTEGLITGNGGKLIALGGFSYGAIRAFFSGSLDKMIVPSVMGMVLGIGPSIVTGSISAII